MKYEGFDLTGATFTPVSTSHYWHGWRFDILGPAAPGAIEVGDYAMPDTWIQQSTRLHDGKQSLPRTTHGINARDWFGLAQPAYDKDHARMLILAHYWTPEQRAGWRAAVAAGTDYDALIKDVRRRAAEGCAGYHGGCMSYQTHGGAIVVKVPVPMKIELVAAIKLAFLRPGEALQLAMF